MHIKGYFMAKNSFVAGVTLNWLVGSERLYRLWLLVKTILLITSGVLKRRMSAKKPLFQKSSTNCYWFYYCSISLTAHTLLQNSYNFIFILFIYNFIQNQNRISHRNETIKANFMSFFDDVLLISHIFSTSTIPVIIFWHFLII